MADPTVITRKQLEAVAASLRWRGATPAQARQWWRDTGEDNQRWWLKETERILDGAGIVLAPSGSR